MEIGLRFECDWRKKPHWQNFIAKKSIDSLREIGISYIEFGIWHQEKARCYSLEEEITVLEEESSFLINKGFSVNVHPYIHANHPGSEYLKAYIPRGKDSPDRIAFDKLIKLSKSITEQQQKLLVFVIHPAVYRWTPNKDIENKQLKKIHEDLLFRTKRFFSWSDAYIRRSRLPILFVSENQPPEKNKIAIGETPDELLETIQDTEFGLCWDTGHYFRASQWHNFDPYPERKFLKSIRHVHLHGVVNGLDHQPVTLDNSYLLKCLDLLYTVGYEGNITLEYNYARHKDSNAEEIFTVIKQGVETILRSFDK